MSTDSPPVDNQQNDFNQMLVESQDRTEEVLDEVERYTSFDTDNLDIAMMNGPKNMSRMQRLFYSEGTKLKRLQDTLKTMRLNRWKFYQGKLPSDFYRKHPLQETVIKSDVDKYIDADPMITNMNRLINEAEHRVKAIENGIKCLQTRGYDVKTILDYKRFTSGT